MTTHAVVRRSIPGRTDRPIRHFQIPWTPAGRNRPVFRPALFGLVLFTLLFSVPASSQTLSDEPALLAAIEALSTDQKTALQDLLKSHASLQSPRLYQFLMEKARAAYFAAGADRALFLYETAIEVAQTLGDKKRIAAACYNRGLTLSGAGRTQEAIGAYQQARQLFIEAGCERDLIYILSDLGTLYLIAEDFIQARSYSEECLRLAESLKQRAAPAGAWPDEYGVASALSTLAALYQRDGEYARAIAHFQQSLALYQTLDQGTLTYGPQIAETLAGLGRLLKTTGDHRQALRFVHLTLDLTRQLKFAEMEAGVLNDLGVLYLEQEDYEKADEFLSQSLKLRQAGNNRSESARVLLNLAVSAQRRRDFDRVLSGFREALEQATAAGNRDVMIAAGEGVGAVLREKKQYAESLEILDRSLRLAQESEDRTRIAEILWRQSEVYLETGAYDRAAELAESALQRARELRFSNLSYLSATILGQAQLKLKKTDLAIQTLRQAIEDVEQMRHRVAGSGEEQQVYFENKLAPYHALIRLFVERNRTDDALRYAEKARGRVLYDLLRGAGSGSAKAVTAEEKKEEQRLNERIVRLNHQLREERVKPSANKDRLAAMKRELETARLQYASFQNLLRASHPELEPRPTALPSLALEELKSLPQSAETLFLEYVVTEEQTYLFAISMNGANASPTVKVFPIAIKQEELARLVSDFRRYLVSRHLGLAAASRRFYERLVKPAEAELQGKRFLCLIPDGILWDAPFQAALSSSGRHLIEDYALYYAPSLSILAEMARQPKTRPATNSLLAFGNPIAEVKAQTGNETTMPLPDAEVEVQKLAEVFGADRSKVLTGIAADEQSFKRLAANFSHLHLATHGVLENRHPLYSYLLLAKPAGDESEDGLLEAREIMQLDLRADLAVLSACDTGRGKIGAGEGVIGMSWAFFAAGCRATVVSQWPVDSASASASMIHFYEALMSKNAKSPATKAEALRQAALKRMREKGFDHPYFWAGFVMVGSNEP